MGQKVNPHGLRVGVIKNWDSRWFVSDEKFGDTLVSISRKVFGNDTQINNLIKLNGLTSADIADGIPAGTQLRTY